VGQKLARILVAEDEPSLANLYKIVLEKYGHTIVAIVPSGDEVVRIFSRAKPRPDLLILDHRLERMPGLEALKKILEIDPNAKILFASADDSVMEDAISAGAIDYIGKPFSMSELIEVVNSCVA
jgi:two-component system, chemotaxis family, chemotaxis protein CheY